MAEDEQWTLVNSKSRAKKKDGDEGAAIQGPSKSTSCSEYTSKPQNQTRQQQQQRYNNNDKHYPGKGQRGSGKGAKDPFTDRRDCDKKKTGYGFKGGVQSVSSGSQKKIVKVLKRGRQELNH